MAHACSSSPCKVTQFFVTHQASPRICARRGVYTNAGHTQVILCPPQHTRARSDRHKTNTKLFPCFFYAPLCTCSQSNQHSKYNYRTRLTAVYHCLTSASKLLTLDTSRVVTLLLNGRCVVTCGTTPTDLYRDADQDASRCESCPHESLEESLCRYTSLTSVLRLIFCRSTVVHFLFLTRSLLFR